MPARRPVLGLATAFVLVLGGAAPAAGANATYPRSCGKAKPGSFFDVFVTRATTCTFGRATYRAVIAEQDRRDGFLAGVTVAFKVRVTSGGRIRTLRCLALARAHGVHDFTCNTGTGSKRVGVLLDDYS